MRPPRLRHGTGVLHVGPALEKRELSARARSSTSQSFCATLESMSERRRSRNCFLAAHRVHDIRLTFKSYSRGNVQPRGASVHLARLGREGRERVLSSVRGIMLSIRHLFIRLVMASISVGPLFFEGLGRAEMAKGPTVRCPSNRGRVNRVRFALFKLGRVWRRIRGVDRFVERSA